MSFQQFGNALIGAALATGVSSVQANGSIDPLEGIQAPLEITMTKEQVRNLCAATTKNSDLILNYKEICKTPENKKKKTVPAITKKPEIAAKKPAIIAEKPVEHKSSVQEAEKSVEQKPPSVEEQEPVIREQKPLVQEQRNTIPKKTEKPKQLKKVPESMKQEVSIDNGKTWISLEQALLMGG